MIENILRKYYLASPVPKISHEFKAAAGIATAPSVTMVSYGVKPCRDFAKLKKEKDVFIGFITAEVDRVLAAMATRALEELHPKPADPLDAMIDGQKLRCLLSIDERSRRETNTAAGVVVSIFTPAQRAAVSAHWSAQLRAKVAASEAERRARAPSVMMSIDPEDL